MRKKLSRQINELFRQKQFYHKNSNNFFEYQNYRQ